MTMEEMAGYTILLIGLGAILLLGHYIIQHTASPPK